jgi:hypothetical protein
MILEFSGKIFHWRGPAPHYFVAVPTTESENIKMIASLVTYGWGVIPVRVTIGQTTWKTSLFPKEGRYLVPLKVMARDAEGLEEGDTVEIRLDIGP